MLSQLFASRKMVGCVSAMIGDHLTRLPPKCSNSCREWPCDLTGISDLGLSACFATCAFDEPHALFPLCRLSRCTDLGSRARERGVHMRLG
jgi:hypothetical protein